MKYQVWNSISKLKEIDKLNRTEKRRGHSIKKWGMVNEWNHVGHVGRGDLGRRNSLDDQSTNREKLSIDEKLYHSIANHYITLNLVT